MTTTIEQILSYESIDLSTFEVRGVKPGVNNARTTSPVYDGTTYYPERNKFTGTGIFDGIDSSSISSINFDPPYSMLNAKVLKASDLIINRALDATFCITEVLGPSSVLVDKTPSSAGPANLTFVLTQREYLVEPDTSANSTHGNAVFTNSSQVVHGIDTDWLSSVSSGDFIKHDGHLRVFIVRQVLDNSTLTITQPYSGDTTTGPYTIFRGDIGRQKIRYVKDAFIYDNQSGRWKYDATTDSNISTSRDYAPLADGITLKFSDTLSQGLPDISEKWRVYRSTFSRSTLYDTFQFPLPVVPNPVSSMELIINDKLKDMYPYGNRDYILNYTQNPIWEFPPPPEKRAVCNVMFLDHEYNRTIEDTSLTESGQIQFLVPQQSGGYQNLSGIMPGSEKIWIDRTEQVKYEQYVLEPISGLAEIVDYTTNEPLVKYVAANYSEYVDYGFEVFRNGVRQQISFPPRPNDDLIFQPRTGRFKPANQDKPSPTDVYEFRYQVEGMTVRDEQVTTIPGATSFETAFKPVKRGSVFLLKNKSVLIEDQDYQFTYQTGTVILFNPMMAGDLFTISYTPLARQCNDLSYDSTYGTMFCTSHDVRVQVFDSTEFGLKIYNSAVNLSDGTSSVLRVYNETRQKDYNLAGAVVDKQIIRLQKDSTNLAIGLDPSDIVTVDYRFASDRLEYIPVVINNFVLAGGSSTIHLGGVNIADKFIPGAVLKLVDPNSSTQYHFFIDSSAFTGTETIIGLKSTIPYEITNPLIYVSDATISFLTVPLAMKPAMEGSTYFAFKGPNITQIFRPGTLIKLGNDLYSAIGSTYDRNLNETQIRLSSPAISNYFDPSVLSSVEYSDAPLYSEGDTELTPIRKLATLDAPGLIICQNANKTISVSTDTSGLIIDGIRFDYSSTTIADLSSSIAASSLTSLSVRTYVPDWHSKNLIPLDGTQYLYLDSSIIIGARPELRLNGADTTFERSASDGVVLSSPLAIGQRCSLDYMGRHFLDTSTVSFSVDYFTQLPKNSNVKASFEYDNIDQFYIQVMSRKDFFENVTVPRMQQEAPQLNGNAGQGGPIPTDEAGSNSEGGIVDDAFRLRDAEIECRIFKNIYDFFSNRLEAYGDELLAIEGIKLFNNDGIFTNAQQELGTKTFNRIFPTPSYRNFEPETVNPLTGRFRNSGAVFTKGSNIVYNVGDVDWYRALPIGSDSTVFINRMDSTKTYRVRSVDPDSKQLVLVSPFEEGSSQDREEGDVYQASVNYPAYDDDGYMGPKIVSTKVKNDKGRWSYRLLPGDKFDCNLGSYTFGPYPFPPFAPLWLTASDVAAILTNNIPGLEAAAEDITTPDGNIKTVLVLRTTYPNNVLSLGSGNAVKKLGFTPYATSIGNWDRFANKPESYLLYEEGAHIGPISYMVHNEVDLLNDIRLAGIPDKFNRVNSINKPKVEANVSHIISEYNLTELELDRLYKEIVSLRVLISEPARPGYTDALYAYQYANQFYMDTYPVYLYDKTVATTLQDKTTTWQWILDWDGSRVQNVKGINSSGVAVDTSVGSGITPINGQMTFLIEVPPDYDARIVGDWTSTIYTPPEGIYYGPQIYYTNTGEPVPGHWTLLDPTASYHHTISNKIRFWCDETDYLFEISLSRITEPPSYATTASDMKLTWTEDMEVKVITYPYSSYKTVSSLVSAIDSVAGFGCHPINDMNYDYTNLKPQVTPLGGSPGAIVYTGSNSPAFSLKFNNHFNITSTYISVGDATFTYESYPTLDGLAAAINNLEGFTVTNYFAPLVPYESLKPASGSVTPNMNIFFGSDVYPIGVKFTGSGSSPTYTATDTHLILSYMNGDVFDTTHIPYAPFPTLGDLVDAMEANLAPVWSTTLLYDARTYNYQKLKMTPMTPVSSTSYTPIAIKEDVIALTLSPNIPSYECTSTNFAVIFPDSGRHEFPYSNFPRLSQLVSAVDAIPNIDATCRFDPNYNYGYLMTGSGLISTSWPGTYINFNTTNPAPLFSVFFNQRDWSYLVDSSGLNIFWYEDTTACSKSFRYSDYTTVLSVKNGIDAMPGLNAAGDSRYNNRPSEAFKIASDILNPNAYIYPGLHECDVTYATISDRLMNQRINFVNGDRSSALTERKKYLDSTRWTQINRYLQEEEILRTPDGNTGDLWTWANNRFHRRQGCEARLNQIKEQMKSNSSTLQINQSFM